MLMPNYEELVELKNKTNPHGLGAKTKATSSVLGGHASLFKGRGLDFSEFREYAIGDDIRTIDWRVTARMGRAHVKVFTEERERSVYVIVDVNCYMQFGTRKTFKHVQAARVAALLAWSVHSLNDKFGAILFGHIPDRIRYLPAKRSRKSIWQMLKMLCAENQCTHEVEIGEALAIADQCIPTGSSVFIISDFFNLTNEFEEQFGLLSKRCDVTLVKVNDPADKDIPQADEINFSNGHECRLLVNTNDTEAAKLYCSLWHESEAALAEMARKFRSKIIKVTTDREVSDDLFNALNPKLRRKGS